MSKRLFDVLVVMAAFPLWFPLLLATGLLVRLKIGSPVFFRQPRAGQGGRVFNLVKFRTMTDARGPSGELLADHDRLGPVGRWLRSTSLDELPELWNVLTGEMSLVGPRPLLVSYLDRYTPEQARRQTVLPGLTGWAQIRGRNAVSWNERFQLDTWYVDNRSLWLDVRILACTIPAVLARHGINASEETTMPEFKGSALAQVGSTPEEPGS